MMDVMQQNEISLPVFRIWQQFNQRLAFQHVQDKFGLGFTPERHESEAPGNVCRGITGAAAQKRY